MVDFAAPSSVSRQPTGYCMSATCARRCSTGCSRKQHGGAFMLRLDDTDRARTRRSIATAIETDLPGWARLDARGAAVGSARRLRRGARPADRGGPALCLLRDAGGARVQAQASCSRRAGRRSTTAPRSNSAMPTARALEAEGRRPHWRFKLDQRRTCAGTIWCAGRSTSTGEPERSGAGARRRQLSLHASPRWSTTSPSPSRT